MSASDDTDKAFTELESILDKRREDSRSAPCSAKRFSKKVESLLDAAFSELQHDTGETDPEWVYQRNLLGKKFTRILKQNHQAPESAV